LVVNSGREYRAEADIRNARIPERAFADFVAGIEPYQLSVSEQKRGVAIAINEYKPIDWIPGEGERLPLPPINIDAPADDAPANGDAADDDDLDAFEKAARRTLHGEKAIPRTSREKADGSASNTNVANDRATIIKGIYQLPDLSVKVLAAWTRLFVEAGGGWQ
jgi:hypothetical protein